MSSHIEGADVGRWYERFAPALRGVAASVTRNADDADDSLHDAFLAAWTARDRFDIQRDPLPWLVTIAHRKALSTVARRSRAARPVPAAPPAPSAADIAERRESDREVRALVRAEPALALRTLGDLSLRDVGESLGVPMRTAASQIRRGRERVRTALTGNPTRLIEV